jgi:hypothetical protein
MNVVYFQSNDRAQRTRGTCTSQPIDSKIVYFTPDERNGRACHRLHSNGSQRNPRATGILLNGGRLLARDIGSVFSHVGNRPSNSVEPREIWL